MAITGATVLPSAMAQIFTPLVPILWLPWLPMAAKVVGVGCAGILLVVLAPSRSPGKTFAICGSIATALFMVQPVAQFLVNISLPGSIAGLSLGSVILGGVVRRSGWWLGVRVRG